MHRCDAQGRGIAQNVTGSLGPWQADDQGERIEWRRLGAPNKGQ
jgi:hypothetical protein